MNRQIKFRGFCTTCKEKIEGDLIHGVGSKFGKFFILPIQHNLAGVQHCHPLDGVEVFPDSIRQFTGLQDTGGKDIYEGDILKVEWQKDSIGSYLQMSDSYIEYKEIVFVSYLKLSFVLILNNGKYFNLPKSCTITIIGNIYENPELSNNTNA